MKYLKFALLFALSISLFSCTDGENDDTLEGDWNLVEITSLNPTTYDLGVNVWDFDLSAMTVEIKYAPNDLMGGLGLGAGTYDFTLDGNDISILEPNGDITWNSSYEINGESLVMDSGIVLDSPLLNFRRTP